MLRNIPLSLRLPSSRVPAGHVEEGETVQPFDSTNLSTSSMIGGFDTS